MEPAGLEPAISSVRCIAWRNDGHRWVSNRPYLRASWGKPRRVVAPSVGTRVPVWYPRRGPDAPAGKPLTPHRVLRLRNQEDRFS
jgi:hypothetical protein